VTHPFAKLRAYPRRKTGIPIQVLAVTDLSQTRRDTSAQRFIAHDISAGGLGVETLVPLDLGHALELELFLPGGLRIVARATVKNLQRENRGGREIYKAGLQFMQISDAHRKAISDYVGSGDFMV
jgi:c-di-GMP-binding flagellar brake protein YcgR